MIAMNNPIKDNRIVSDKTFAIRLRNFIKNVQVNDAASEEERDYLLMVSKDLLQYQVDTATDKFELEYIKKMLNYD